MDFLLLAGDGENLEFYYRAVKNPYLKELLMTIIKVLGKKICVY